MEYPKWQRQTKKQPLFNDLLWSKPENKQHAGRLLIIGGNAQGFAAPAEAYAQALKAGIGEIRVIVPDKLEKTLRSVFPSADFAPSTPSGSFSQAALATFIENAQWASGVLVCGDLGHNSETAILLEKFVSKFDGQVTLSRDAADYFTLLPSTVLKRVNTLMVLSIAQLQKLARESSFPRAFTFDMDFIRLCETLYDFNTKFGLNIIVKHLSNIFVVSVGQVSATKLELDIESWRVQTAARAAVWWLQNPDTTFEALTTSLIA